MTLLFTLSASAASEGAVLHAVLTDESGAEHTVDVYGTGGSYYLFLPATADASSLTIKYTGRQTVRYGTQKYKRGESFTVDASSGTVSISETGTNTKYKIKIMKGGIIPTVYVDLDGGDDAFHAVCADKSHEESGTISVIGTNGGIIYSGGLEKFKGHGFTSFVPSSHTTHKNSYNIKLEQKAELIPDSGKIKKWVLLSPRLNDDSRDSTGLSQLLAFHTYTGLIREDLFGMKGEYVDLYVNGDYRGVYILCERMNDGGAIDVTDLDKQVNGEGKHETVKANKAKDDPAIKLGIREYKYNKGTSLKNKNTDITGGYVLEVMCGMYEDCGFITDHGLYFSIKSPEFCTKEMVQYIASYVQSFENAIYSETGYNNEGHHYTEYADVESLADMILVYAFYQNFEYFRTSTYIYKDADTELHNKLTFGPVWDFETNSDSIQYDYTFFGTANWFTYFVEQQYIWSEQLWQHGDFMTVMYRENEKMKTTLDSLKTDVEDIIIDVSASQAMSKLRWNARSYEKAANKYVEALKTRYDSWYGSLWGDDYLLYLDVETAVNEDGTITLTAAVGGTSSGRAKWYVLDQNDPTQYKIYNNNSGEITVPSDGAVYFCTVSGGNNACLPFAAGEIFSNEKITMRSAPIKADAEALTPPEPETEPVTEPVTEDDPANTSGCGSSVSITPIVIAFIPALFIVKKKNKKLS